MNIILLIVWLLAMIIYSFSSDYAHAFPNHGNRAVPWMRWGSLLLAMGLSAVLAKVYQQHLQGTGMWVFVLVVLVVITAAKLVFSWVLKRRLGH